MICKSAVQKNPIFAIHKSYNISYNYCIITSQANVNLELRKNTGVTLWPWQRNQVAKHASDWFEKKKCPDWLGEQCMYFLPRSKERSATYISGVSWGKGEERSEQGRQRGCTRYNNNNFIYCKMNLRTRSFYPQVAIAILGRWLHCKQDI